MRPRLACLLLLAIAGAGGACWSSGDRNRPPSVSDGSGPTEPPVGMGASVLRTDGGYAFDEAMWAPWEVPAL